VDTGCEAAIHTVRSFKDLGRLSDMRPPLVQAGLRYQIRREGFTPKRRKGGLIAGMGNHKLGAGFYVRQWDGREQGLWPIGFRNEGAIAIDAAILWFN